MLARLTESADFQRVLAQPSRWRSAHFAVHHLAAEPLARRPAARVPATPGGTGDAERKTAEAPEPGSPEATLSGLGPDSLPTAPLASAAEVQRAELSTATAPSCTKPVDKLRPSQWLGYVVPKRHAKRAVTRSLLKRQIRCAFGRHAASLPAGQWLVRVRAPFAREQFPSARSAQLAAAARLELDALLARASA